MPTGPAWAGSWVVDKSAALVITTFRFSTAEQSLDEDGRSVSGTDFAKVELDTYLELGLTPRLMLTGQIAVQDVAIDYFGFTDSATGLSASRLGLQYQWLDAGHWASSIQLSAVLAGSSENVADRPLGEGANGVELRFLAGRAIGGQAFIDTQTAWHWREGGFPDEGRFETTLGYRPSDNWTVMFQNFSNWSAADPATGYRAFAQHKLQFDIGRRIGGAEIHAGAYTTWRGRNTVDESGLIISWWARY